MSPFLHALMKPVCKVGASPTCYVLGLRYWNSDDIKPLQSAKLTASPHGDAMLHGASNRRYILIAGSSNWLFFIPQISNTELTTESDFCSESYKVVAYRPEFSVCRNADSSNCMLLYINIKHSATMAYIRIILTQILPLDSICAII